jgi:choline dehydrogenase-like flavoprotein
MPRRFDLNDDSLVVIIGSGAGGGTLGNELAQKAIRTLILEAGPRIEPEQSLETLDSNWLSTALGTLYQFVTPSHPRMNIPVTTKAPLHVLN